MPDPTELARTPTGPDDARRNLLKLGATAVPGALLVSSATPSEAITILGLPLPGVGTLLGVLTPPSPPPAMVSPRTQPFLEPLPFMPVLPARSLSDPAFATFPPTQAPNRAINPATRLPYEGRGDSHQLRERNPPQFFYAQRFGAVPPVSVHPELARQINFWGANLGGADLSVDRPMTPMPTIVSRCQAGANTAILVRRFNQLPTGTPSGGFGKNSISTHLHNFHSAPDSDGGPCDPGLGALAEDPMRQGRFFFPGQYYDYYYNMKRAGFASTHAPDGDVRESLGTLWYHDHREAHTAENVYKGLAGFHILFNEYDTGDETTGFRLPSFPAFDIPVVFTDLLIDPATGQAALNFGDDSGHLGDKYLVNGKVQPFFDVAKRRYRFRLLDMGPSRFYRLFLVNPDNPTQVIPFWRIANDGNLYEKPIQVNHVKLAPGERADVILDFAKLTSPGGPAAGATRLWLENRLIQLEGKKPTDMLNPPGTPANVLMEYRIGAPVADASADPASITSFAPITLPPLETPAVTRVFEWDRKNGTWTCNDKVLDCTRVRFTMKRGRLERWIHRGGGGWAHPIHNHFVEGRIMRRDGVALRPGHQEWCRKDVVPLYPNDEIEYWVRATDYVGVYPMHCHNVVHEDYGMMLLFRVDDVGDTRRVP